MASAVTWNIHGGRTLGPAPFFVFGVVNVTPDSFYDGGTHNAPDDALAHARILAAQGAAVLDVGGESTRPFADPVDAEEEARRVLPVIDAIMGDPVIRAAQGGEPVVSVDTYRAATADAAICAGASIVNDVSAWEFDPGFLEVLAQHKPGYVLMHSLGKPGVMQQDPQYEDVVEEIYAFLERKLNELVRAGLPEECVVVDPGIGFGKTLEHNLAILRRMDRFAELGRPVMAALSNKSLFAGLLGLDDPARRGNATQAATAVLAARGVRVHRVHDVEYAVQSIRVGQALAAGDVPGA